MGVRTVDWSLPARSCSERIKREAVTSPAPRRTQKPVEMAIIIKSSDLDAGAPSEAPGCVFAIRSLSFVRGRDQSAYHVDLALRRCWVSHLGGTRNLFLLPAG